MSVKRWIPGVVLAGVVLSGCAQTLAGSAAVVGDERLTDDQLSQTVGQLTDSLSIQPSDQVSQAIISRWMVGELVQQLADDKGITVSKGEVDAAVADEAKAAGGQEALEQSALQAGVLPDGITDAIKVTLLIDKMTQFTVTGDDPTGQAGLVVQVQQLSEQLDAQVSPRYGTWDAQQLTVGALPDDLSTPVTQQAPVQLQPQQ